MHSRLVPLLTPFTIHTSRRHPSVVTLPIR